MTDTKKARDADTDERLDPEAIDETVDSDDDAGEDFTASDEAEEPESGGDLFRHSEIAADYIEGLLDILDVDGDIDELVQNGRPMVEVVGGRLNSLVGSRGATAQDWSASPRNREAARDRFGATKEAFALAVAIRCHPSQGAMILPERALNEAIWIRRM